jgi:uncharacterized membrane protein
MAIKLRYTSPTGESRPWTLLEIVQGQPLGHPSHPLFVHFPVAFYIGVLAFDLLTRLHPNPGLVFAATLLIIGAFMGSAFAVTTGLVDWFQMVPGSKKRRKATQHALLQVSTFVLFVVALAIRWSDRHAPRASWGWIVIEAIAVAILVVGQYLGGMLVYQMAMRVRTSQPAD